MGREEKEEKEEQCRLAIYSRTIREPSASRREHVFKFKHTEATFIDSDSQIDICRPNNNKQSADQDTTRHTLLGSVRTGEAVTPPPHRGREEDVAVEFQTFSWPPFLDGRWMVVGGEQEKEQQATTVTNRLGSVLLPCSPCSSLHPPWYIQFQLPILVIFRSSSVDVDSIHCCRRPLYIVLT